MIIDVEIFCILNDEFGDRYVDSCVWCWGSGILGLYVMFGLGFFFLGEGDRFEIFFFVNFKIWIFLNFSFRFV